MNLLPEELRKRIPSLYATENQEDPIVQCKFFTPWGWWSYYVIEFDGKDLLYGWVNGPFPELGYSSLSEITSMIGQFGLGVERDLYFKPCLLSEVQKMEEAKWS